ncbi:MAG TPA: class I SAM-dependent methyltransferase [Thermoplasmata archaeon]|nr:class I SAM-dependent methyltransferase [Thermoplasmata archaeon]
MQPETDPDTAWVAQLTGADPRTAVQAVGEAAGRQDLFRAIEREHRLEGRSSYVEIEAPLELHALVRLMRPAHVVEVGVSSGVSSAYLLDALDLNGSGTLHSIDLPSFPRKRAPESRPARMSWTLPPGRSPGWAVPFRLRRRWDLRLGDKADGLPVLAEELERIDLFVYDVPHDD